MPENTTPITATESYELKNLSFGEKAVGLKFNPSGDLMVDEIKKQCAYLIDLIAKNCPSVGDMKHRISDQAILSIMEAQMRSVKAITFKE